MALVLQDRLATAVIADTRFRAHDVHSKAKRSPVLRYRPGGCIISDQLLVVIEVPRAYRI